MPASRHDYKQHLHMDKHGAPNPITVKACKRSIAVCILQHTLHRLKLAWAWLHNHMSPRS